MSKVSIQLATIGLPLVKALATIWFRLLVVYTVSVVLAIFAVVTDHKPWERQGREILDEKPVLCELVEPHAAAEQVEADKKRLAALSGSEIEPALSQEFLAKLAGLTEHSPAELKERFTLPSCIEYRERLATWHATAERNWRGTEYWSTSTRRATLFVLPAWLFWAAVYWAVFSPLLHRDD